MNENDPNKSEKDGRVVPFRPRVPGRVEAFSNLAGDRSPIDDLQKYARRGDDHEEYAHRMKVNAIAVLFLALLVGGGIWVVDTMAQLRKGQDCVLSGRRNCATSYTPTNTH